MQFYNYQPINRIPVKMSQSPSMPRFDPIRNVSSPDSRDLFRNTALDLKNRMTPTLVKSNNFSTTNTPWGSNVFLSPTYSNPDLNPRQHRFSENLGRNQTFSHGIANVRHFGDIVTREIPNVRHSHILVSPTSLDHLRKLEIQPPKVNEEKENHNNIEEKKTEPHSQNARIEETNNG